MPRTGTIMTALLTALHLAWTALAAVVITRRTRNPASAGVWLLLVFALDRKSVV